MPDPPASVWPDSFTVMGPGTGRHGLMLAAGYLVLAVGAGSLLAYLLTHIIDLPYLKLLSRSVLLCAALGMVPLWRSAGLSVRAVGLLPAPGVWLWRPFVLALAGIGPLMLLFMVTGYRVGDSHVVAWSTDFLAFAAAAVVGAWLVAVFEEVLFRGVMFASLRRFRGPVVAAVITSLLYAAVHFLDPPPGLEGEVSALTGYVYVWHAFAGLGRPGEIWDSFVALALLGGLLCWVRQHFSLWHCVAMHAAWVLGIRVFKELTVRDVVSPYQGLVGSYDNFVGHAASAWLLFLFVVIALQRRAALNAR